jgi:nucleotide-binding universal stress UspA family protein
MTTSQITADPTDAVARARVHAQRSHVRDEGLVSRLAPGLTGARRGGIPSSNATEHPAPSLAVSEDGDGRERWVVVGYDGSDAAARALERAAKAAGRHGTVVIVASKTRSDSSGRDAEALIERADDPSRLLEDARRLLATHALVTAVVSVARHGDPAEHLMDTARAVGADLLVIGRRGKNLAARTLPGSVATRVVSHAPCDVLVVA